MRVLMLGWEFPPFISGGLGTACHGLTKGLSELGVPVIFVLPRSVRSDAATHVQLLSGPRGSAASNGWRTISRAISGVAFRGVNVQLYPYGSPGALPAPVGETQRLSILSATRSPVAALRATEPSRPGVPPLEPPPAVANYSGDLFGEIGRYIESVSQIACEEAFDVIHAHDWMTFQAGAVASRLTGKPLVVHIHSTEFDRSGENIHQAIYDIEREGMYAADHVIVVSQLTRRICIQRYGVPAEKVTVVYNAVNGHEASGGGPRLEKTDKVVLFLGRITMQKGPEYFLAAAKKVLERVPNAKFVMAGTGDMVPRIVELAASLGIGHRVLFTGFLRGNEVDKAFKMADLYVMPSVSEPFGITPLEALARNVPVLISKQSGVSEVLTHALKVDFWDIDEMANKMISILTRTPLRQTLRQNGSHEVRKFNWTQAARQCLDIYADVINRCTRGYVGEDSGSPAGVPALQPASGG